jgi:hypothetical protein
MLKMSIILFQILYDYNAHVQVYSLENFFIICHYQILQKALFL